MKNVKEVSYITKYKIMGSHCFVFIFLLRLEKDYCSLQSCIESCESVSSSVTQYLTVDKTKLDGELMELNVSKKNHS